MPTLRLTPTRPRPRSTVLAAALGSAILATALVVTTAGPSHASSDPDTVSMAAPEPANQLAQLTGPGVHTGHTAVSGSSTAAPGTVCQRGAQWLRLRFTDLKLRGSDSVTLSGNRGDTFTLTARHWPGKAFHTRAFRGDCVQINPQLADLASSYRVDAYQYGEQSLAEAAVTVAAVGDVCGSSCDQTAPLVEAMNPAALILAGDNAYDSGSLSEYRSKYDPQYGQFKSITYPTPGNHEYKTSNASGYFDYFGARAGERGKGYYSFDVGDWHFVAMNSEISHGTGSTQEKWLRSDLAANTKPCTAAYWHSPRFSRGDHGDDTGMRPLFQALYDNGADIVVTGHDHNYQRFAPSRPDGTRDDDKGIRQFVIGTGGRGFYNFDQSSDAVTEASNANTFGVGKMTLSATGYTVDFVPVKGREYTDTVTGKCHKATTSPDFSVTANPASVAVAQGGTASTSVNVASVNGFSASTALSVSGLPAGVQAEVAPNPVTPPANGTATATLKLIASTTAAAGTADVTVTGTAAGVSHTAKVQLTVTPGGDTVFSDDFETDKGWTVNASGTDTATSGKWERGDPEQTTSTYSNQIKQRGDTTSGANCLVTGRLAGATDGANDVDGGVTSSRSPVIGVPATGTSTLSFNYTYATGDNSTADDFFRVKVVDGGTATTVLERRGAATELAGAWQAATPVNLTPFAGRSVSLVVEAADASGGSLWEAAVDDVRVTNSGSGTGEAGFTVAADPGTLTIPQGQKNLTTVTVGSVNGFDAPVTLSATGAPSDVATQWHTNPVTPSATTELVIATTASTAPATFDLTITGTAGAVAKSTTVQVKVTTGGGFTDDFETDKGWTVNPAGTDTATSGRWERGDPEQTTSTYSNQIKQLGTTVSGANCLVTGRLAGANDGANDLDGGASTVRSPSFAVPAGAARLTFQFTVAHGDNSGAGDYLRIKVIDGTATTTVFEVLGTATERPGEWRAQSVDLSAYSGRTVQLLIDSADTGTASLWESAVDDVAITTG